MKFAIAAGLREVASCGSCQPWPVAAVHSILVLGIIDTPGQAAKADFEMIRDAGFVLEGPDGQELAVDAL